MYRDHDLKFIENQQIKKRVICLKIVKLNLVEPMHHSEFWHFLFTTVVKLHQLFKMNSSSINDSTLMFNNTNTSIHRIYQTDLDCDTSLLTSPFIIYCVTAIHHIFCLISTIISLVIIFKFYLPAKSIIKPFKFASICAITFWMSANIAWIIDWHHVSFACPHMYNLTFYKGSETISKIYNYARIVAIFTQGMGYSFFCLSFLFRAIYAFKDSLFEISIPIQLAGYGSCIFFSSAFVVIAILRIIWEALIHFTGAELVWLTPSAFFMIVYIIANITWLRIMIKKLFQFQQFLRDRNNINYKINNIDNNTNSIHDNTNINISRHNDPNNDTVEKLYQLIKRLTVL